MVRKCLAMVLFISCVVFAGDPVSEIQAKAKSIKSVKADITQTIDMGQTMNMTGVFMFKLPLNFALELDSMMGKINTVSDGKTMYVVMPAANMAQKIDLARVMEADPSWSPDQMDDPTDPFRQYRDIQFAKSEDVGGVACYHFKAKLGDIPSMNQMPVPVDHVKLWFGIADGFPRKVIMTGEDGSNLITILYTNVNTNVPLDDSLFTFSPSGEMNVMDMTDTVMKNVGGQSPSVSP